MSAKETPNVEHVVIIDYGSQYTQLIARRIRELEVFCTIRTPSVSKAELDRPDIKAIVLSGGPASVYGAGAPQLPSGFQDIQKPILGICYGMQLLGQAFGGSVTPAKEREFGRRRLLVKAEHELFRETPDEQTVWMSHGDQIDNLGLEFFPLASTETCPWAAMRHKSRPIVGIQFHPEVHHSEFGRQILRNFLFGVAHCRGDWKMSSFIDDQIKRIREKVGKARVICGLSGGVDSSVAAVLVHRAIGDQLSCVFVDNGLLRLNEAEEVETIFKTKIGLELICVDARERFLSELAGVEDPEQKRKIIGRLFIRVFEDAAKKIDGARFLVQGTLYPDVIESVAAHGGPTAVIKSHHNVGGLPKDLGFDLIEPLRDLFKDEVRAVGRELGVPEQILWRHPFPGPGLAVRILGPVDGKKAALLQRADAIVREEITKAGLYNSIWQAFAVLLPVRSVGVMGDERTYENVCAVRAVTSTDGMTADWYRMPHDVLAVISNRIINEVRGINRVVYDISSKPPATIEWE